MDASIYKFAQSKELFTPVFLYYKDIIEENVKKLAEMSGDPSRLWPHVKTHKSREMIRLQMKYGITRFKCATIAEAEMAASCSPTDVLLAYPLVGPNIRRFVALQKAYPEVNFWAIGDDLEQMRLLGAAAVESGTTIRLLADVNPGMDRTGVTYEKLEDFCVAAAAIDGLEFRGFHTYDGHVHQESFEERMQLVKGIMEDIYRLQSSVKEKGCTCDTIVMGGSPSFSCYIHFDGIYFSPGTLVINDYDYYCKFKDLDFVPAAVIMTRVVSRPTATTFTLDLGHKAISTDRRLPGTIVGMEETAIPVAQSEEHWVFRMAEGYEDQCPKIGDELFVFPTHVCPSCALYPNAPVVSGGEIVETWETTARLRTLQY